MDIKGTLLTQGHTVMFQSLDQHHSAYLRPSSELTTKRDMSELKSMLLMTPQPREPKPIDEVVILFFVAKISAQQQKQKQRQLRIKCYNRL